MKKQEMSCVDCAVQNCNKMDGTYPEFCLTTHMDESVLQDAMNCYEEEENHKVMIAAAEVEYRSKENWNRNMCGAFARKSYTGFYFAGSWI